MKTYKAKWQALIKRELEGYKEIGRSDEFEDWSLLVDHGGDAADWMCNGIALLSGDGPSTLARRYFKKSLNVADRAIAENVFQRNRTKRFFPGNRGEALRVKVYAEWFVKGKLNRAMLSQAAGDLLAWVEQPMPRSEWDEIPQEEYLSAIAAVLISEDQTLLKSRRVLRRCPALKTRFWAIEALAKSVLNGKPFAEKKRFDVAFDHCRSYGKASTLEALEFAVLRQMFVEPSAKGPSPLETIALMSK